MTEVLQKEHYKNDNKSEQNNDDADEHWATQRETELERKSKKAQLQTCPCL